MARLLDLPPELLEVALTHLDLPSALHFASTTRSVRASLQRSGAWSSVLLDSATFAGVNLRASEENPDAAASRALILASSSSAIPSRAWVPVLAVLDRDFALHYFDLPALSDEQWEQTCRVRFMPSLIAQATNKSQSREAQTTAWAAVRPWRAVYISESLASWHSLRLKVLTPLNTEIMARLEHSSRTGCQASTHQVCSVLQISSLRLTLYPRGSASLPYSTGRKVSRGTVKLCASLTRG